MSFGDYFQASKTWGQYRACQLNTFLLLSIKIVILGDSNGKEYACNAEDLGSISGWEDALEKGMATHLSIRAWGITWTEDPGWL